MIIDLCNPLNEGESNTVKMTVSIWEAKQLYAQLTTLPELLSGIEVAHLVRGLQRCLNRQNLEHPGWDKPR